MVDGIWYVDIFGMYGWESIGMLVLNDGHVVGGGDHHYTLGSYTVSGDGISVSHTMNYKDVTRTLFGEARNKFEVVFEGTYNDEKKRFEGLMHRPRKAKMAVGCRLKKGADLPWSVPADTKKPKNNKSRNK